MTSAGKRIELEHIKLGEVTQSQKDECHVFSVVWSVVLTSKSSAGSRLPGVTTESREVKRHPWMCLGAGG